MTADIGLNRDMNVARNTFFTLMITTNDYRIPANCPLAIAVIDPKLGKNFVHCVWKKNNFKITLKTKCNESEINKRFQKLILLRRRRSLVGGKDNEINMWRYCHPRW
uniref:Uncharacterized protein n=1 Tax=Glossina pallidipes TaxID=7398 RepID=A0A1B0AG56_GLOPL